MPPQDTPWTLSAMVNKPAFFFQVYSTLYIGDFLLQRYILNLVLIL